LQQLKILKRSGKEEEGGEEGDLQFLDRCDPVAPGNKKYKNTDYLFEILFIFEGSKGLSRVQGGEEGWGSSRKEITLNWLFPDVTVN
jgi:hypothetical protein